MGIYVDPDQPPIVPDAFLSGTYQLQFGSPVWMPEIGLGIGYERENYAGVTREWLYWYDQTGNRYPTPNERIEQESLRAQQESLLAQQESQRAVRSEQRVEELTQRLRALGIDPDSL